MPVPCEASRHCAPLPPLQEVRCDQPQSNRMMRINPLVDDPFRRRPPCHRKYLFRTVMVDEGDRAVCPRSRRDAGDGSVIQGEAVHEFRAYESAMGRAVEAIIRQQRRRANPLRPAAVQRGRVSGLGRVSSQQRVCLIRWPGLRRVEPVRWGCQRCALLSPAHLQRHILRQPRQASISPSRVPSPMSSFSSPSTRTRSAAWYSSNSDTKPTAARSRRAAATAWPGVLAGPVHGCPSAASPARMRCRQLGRLMDAGASFAAAKAASMAAPVRAAGAEPPRRGWRSGTGGWFWTCGHPRQEQRCRHDRVAGDTWFQDRD